MKVCVLLGGNSAERDVSLKSGAAVVEALRNQGHDVHPVDPAEDGLQAIVECQPDVVFIALHGRGGEDGTIQGFLQLHKIPYTGSGVMASSVGMDKYATKLIWQAVGLPVAAGLCVTPDDPVPEIDQFPVFVKPVNEGSSIGMSRVDSQQALQEALQLAFEYDRKVLVESFIDGEEFTCAILGDEALPVIGLRTDAVFYDYEAKYQSNDTQYLLPSGLPEAVEKEAQVICQKAFDLLGCEGWGRVDFMRDRSGNIILLEVNTSPGMTSHSLVPMAAQAVGISFGALVDRIILMAVESAA